MDSLEPKHTKLYKTTRCIDCDKSTLGIIEKKEIRQLDEQKMVNQT